MQTLGDLPLTALAPPKVVSFQRWRRIVSEQWKYVTVLAYLFFMKIYLFSPSPPLVERVTIVLGHSRAGGGAASVAFSKVAKVGIITAIDFTPSPAASGGILFRQEQARGEERERERKRQNLHNGLDLERFYTVSAALSPFVRQAHP